MEAVRAHQPIGTFTGTQTTIMGARPSPNVDAVQAGGIVPVDGLHHYTLSVRDLEESALFYAQTFGFGLSYQTHEHGWGRVAYMCAPGFLLEMFDVPDSGPVPSYATGPEPDADLSVCGHKHMALLLDGGLSTAVERIQDLGVVVSSLKTVDLEGIGKFRAAFVTDNTGGLIELPEERSEGLGSKPVRGSQKGPLGITRLHHVALCVPDREEAIAWYSRVFGFTVATRFEVGAIGLRTAMMQGPGFWLELHSRAGALPVPAERRHPETDVRTQGNKYLALGTQDLKGIPEKLERAGIQIIADLKTAYSRRLFVSDNSGNPIELFQVVN
jgi:catechol 2,3-dioxygenase-like lactoylglutathione lyase family enzyme